MWEKLRKPQDDNPAASREFSTGGRAHGSDVPGRDKLAFPQASAPPGNDRGHRQHGTEENQRRRFRNWILAPNHVIAHGIQGYGFGGIGGQRRTGAGGGKGVLYFRVGAAGKGVALPVAVIAAVVTIIELRQVGGSIQRKKGRRQIGR